LAFGAAFVADFFGADFFGAAFFDATIALRIIVSSPGNLRGPDSILPVLFVGGRGKFDD
jgi:hypothetical protein